MQLQKVQNFDLLLTLKANAWSIAYFYLDDECLRFAITHIAGYNPYEDMIDALLLSQKKGEGSFFWFDEPYGYNIELKREENICCVSIYDVLKESYKKITSSDLELQKTFQVDYREFLLLFYLQFKKICLLLKNKEYAVNRSKYFPMRKFLDFERMIKNKFNF